MKNLVKPLSLKFFLTSLMIVFVQFICWAQETTESSTSTKTTVNVTSESQWYSSPWVWVAGAAVFILLLVALLGNRGGSDRTTASSTDRVTVTKTRETDV